MRPLSAEELNKLAGRRLNAAERAAWREAASRRGEIRSNREDPDTDKVNPYGKFVDEFDPESRDPAERQRAVRMRRLYDQKEAELADARAAEATKLQMLEDPDVQKAQEHFHTVLETFDTTCPEDVGDKGDATTALQQVLAGDKDALHAYYAAAERLCDRRTAGIREELDEARKADTDTTVERNRLEAEMAKAEAASLQPPH